MSDVNLLAKTSDELLKSFLFLQEYNYSLQSSKNLNENTFELIFLNKETRKKIVIGLSNYDDVQRFFLNISIIRIPHEVVHDFVSFDTYMEKNRITPPKTLEKNQRNIENANKYIEDYAELFKKYGIELVTTDKQFPHYFPEWT